jgi:uncharacterized phage protein gp47/JayE
MALDSTPDRIVVKSREKIVADYKRDYSIRNPRASLADGEQVDIDAQVFADQMVPIYAAARQAGDAVSLLNQTGDDLDRTWGPRGVSRPAAQGGIGYVIIQASTAGGPIFQGDEIKDLNSGLRFRAAETRLNWQDGDAVPIAGIDTGPATNVAAGTKLTWSRPRPGIGDAATVAEQESGEGLVGGRDRATDDEYRELIRESLANPAAAGNDAQIQQEGRKTPGVPFQQIFTYPAIFGSCTTAVCGLMRMAGSDPATRIPTEIQRQQLEGYIVGLFPKGDVYLFPTIFAQPVDVSMNVRWAKGVAGWQDQPPWPPRYDVDDGRIVIDGVPTSAAAFSLRTDDDDYTGVPSPQVGQTIGFYDKARGIFSRKRIATVTGSGPWDITCSVLLGASDTVYTPFDGQSVSPWSESLQLLVSPLLAVFARLGPGEQVSNVDFLDDGERQRRSPESPAAWPSVLANKDLSDVLKTPGIAEGEFIEGVDVSTTVGVPGVTAYLLTLRDFTVFPKAIS